MKRIVSLFLALLLVLSCAAAAFAEETSEPEGTKFEQVLLKKGSLIKKEFVTIEEFLPDISWPYNTITSEAAILTDMTTNEKFYALRLEYSYYKDKYDNGTVVGVLDIDEVDSVLTTLESLKAEFSGDLVDYTEYVYTSNSGLTIGAYHSKSDNLIIKFNSSTQASIKFDRIDEWIAFFKTAKENIESRM